MVRRYDTLGWRLGSPAARYISPLVGGARQARRQGFRPAGAKWRPEVEVTTADPQSAKLGRLEAAMFLAREPLSTRKLAKLAKLADGTEARTLIRELDRRYQARAHALRVVELAGGFQLLTRPQLADWIVRLHGGTEELRLSAPALETLAVVAYRQPVVRAEVESIRGVQCGEILRVLMERDLLRIVGRAEDLGRPFLYGTTKYFLQVFGLRRLEELPPIDQIRNVVVGAG